MKKINIKLDNTEVILESGSTSKVSELIKKYNGKKVLFLYGQGSIKRNGLYDNIISQFKENNIDYITFSGIKPNPRIEKVYEAVKLSIKNSVDFILAVGGGSVIDSAKVIAASILEGGDSWDYFTYKRVAKKALPLGVVLTIPATGSESNPYTVISNKDDKKSASAEVFSPKFAILDPQNTISLPKDQTAYGLIDIFVHVAEQYFSLEDGGVLRDRFCEAVFLTTIDISLKLIDNLQDEELRMESLWAGNIALSRFLMKGLSSSGDWATHAIEHQISAINDIAHGAGLAIVFPAWLEVVGRKKPEKILKYGKTLFKKDSLKDIVKATRDFFESLGVKTYIDDNSN